MWDWTLSSSCSTRCSPRRRRQGLGSSPPIRTRALFRRPRPSRPPRWARSTTYESPPESARADTTGGPLAARSPRAARGSRPFDRVGADGVADGRADGVGRALVVRGPLTRRSAHVGPRGRRRGRAARSAPGAAVPTVAGRQESAGDRDGGAPREDPNARSAPGPPGARWTSRTAAARNPAVPHTCALAVHGPAEVEHVLLSAQPGATVGAVPLSPGLPGEPEPPVPGVYPALE